MPAERSPSWLVACRWNCVGVVGGGGGVLVLLLLVVVVVAACNVAGAGEAQAGQPGGGVRGVTRFFLSARWSTSRKNPKCTFRVPYVFLLLYSMFL